MKKNLEKLQRKFQENRKKALIGGILAIALFALYAGITYSYAEKFIPGSAINGQDVAGKTVEEANIILQEKYNGKTYVVKEDGKEVTKFMGQNLEMKSDFNAYLKNINENQNKWSWMFSIITSGQEKNMPIGMAFNEEKFKAELDKVDFNSGKRVSSENAKIVAQDGEFTIEPEIYGNELDLEKVEAKILEGIKSGNPSIEIKDCYLKPEVKSEDSNLTAELKKMNSLKDVEVTYTIAGNTVKVPEATTISWISYDQETHEASLDREKVISYLSEINEKYSTIGKTRKFKSTSNGTVDVEGGTYGWSIATASEAEAMTAEFLKGEDIVRTPIINGSGYSSTGTDIGDSYVEVDLSEQHMWLYKDGKVILDTDIISGNPNKGNSTPAGVFYIWGKERNATLRGEDYETPVSYWMPINWSGVGIHDASWQSSFGDELYLTRGSHGCINTPPSKVAEVYNAVNLGTPVIVHSTKEQ